MLHCTPHRPAPQTWPLPQLVPFATLVHAVALTLGSQPWHRSSGFTDPAAYGVPSTTQPEPASGDAAPLPPLDAGWLLDPEPRDPDPLARASPLAGVARSSPPASVDSG
jgi:hypothetical protein